MNTQLGMAVVIQGQTFEARLTQEEYREWVKYDDKHPHLEGISYEAVLNMFLSHFRRGINLNLPLKP